jgi:homoserine acetyltransferase
MRGDDHHAHPGRLNPHLRQHIQTVVFTQTQIKEAQVEHLTLQQRVGLRSAVGGGHAIALVFQAITEVRRMADSSSTRRMRPWCSVADSIFLRSLMNDLG